MIRLLFTGMSTDLHQSEAVVETLLVPATPSQGEGRDGAASSNVESPHVDDRPTDSRIVALEMRASSMSGSVAVVTSE